MKNQSFGKAQRHERGLSTRKQQRRKKDTKIQSDIGDSNARDKVGVYNRGTYDKSQDKVIEIARYVSFPHVGG